MTGEEMPVAQHVARLAERIVVERFDGRVIEEPIPGFQILTRRRLAEPTDGIKAARAIAAAARGLLVEQARAARAAGSTWDEIGEALGLAGGVDDEPRAEAAFTEVVEGRRREEFWPTFRSPSTYWRCSGCGELVTDYGPGVGSHPSDQETGHDESCARHQGEVRAWQTRTGWDE
jgi:hypothetical protein